MFFADLEYGAKFVMASESSFDSMTLYQKITTNEEQSKTLVTFVSSEGVPRNNGKPVEVNAFSPSTCSFRFFEPHVEVKRIYT